MRVAFLGLGIMGQSMATNLVKAGHEVTVWNRTPEKAEPLVRDGARQAKTPAEAANREVVLTSLANDDAVSAVVFGQDGVASGLPRGAAHLSASTISLAMSDRLTEEHARRGQVFVSSPVSVDDCCPSRL